MKHLLLVVAFLCVAPAVHAQLLPVPGAKNPDWTLEKSEVLKEDGSPVPPPPTDRMPNAAQKSVTSIGNRHSCWDANQQLAYAWSSRPNSGSVAPEKRVTVREDRTGTTYTYRRRAQSTPAK